MNAHSMRFRSYYLHSRTSISVRLLVSIAFLCGMVACSTVDSEIRMTPTVGFDAMDVATNSVATFTNSSLAFTNATGVSALSQVIKLYNIDPDGTFVQASGMEALKPDLYVTIDVSPIITLALQGKITAGERNDLTSFMIYLSDRNAEIWEHRLYARYKAREGVVEGLRDLATLGAGASALIIPPVAAGLSAANLIIAPLSDEIDTTLYSKETVEALLKAITASRHAYKTAMHNHFKDAIGDYNMFFALDQLRHYDSLVSFRQGIAYAAQLADEKTTVADAADTNATNASPSPPTDGTNTHSETKPGK